MTDNRNVSVKSTSEDGLSSSTKKVSLFSLNRTDLQEKQEAKLRLVNAKQRELEGRILEFERVSRYFETNLLMHRLAASYFNARAKWLSFFPILVITSLTSLSGIFGTFYGNQVKEGFSELEAEVEVLEEDLGIDEDPGNITGGSRILQQSTLPSEFVRFLATFFSIASAVLGVASTFFASISKYNNYQSKADMHIAAVNTLASICDTIRVNEILLVNEKNDIAVEEIKRQIKEKNKEKNPSANFSDGTDEDAESKSDKKMVACDIETHKNKFNTVKESCTFPIPARIENAFRELYWEFRPAPPKVRKHIYPRLYYALWKKIKEYEAFPRWNPLWFVYRFPIFLPKVDINEFIEEEMGKEDYSYFFKKKQDFINSAFELEPDEEIEKESLEKREAELKEKLKAELAEEMKGKDAECAANNIMTDNDDIKGV